MTEEHIKDVLTKEIATELSMSPGEIDEHASFMKLGVSSVQALKIINRLRKELNMDINPVALFEFKTVSDISEYLADQFE
ncbi:acyl carrier protein [Haloglycomyces albus]|uniref:acyl carrier protein n=1 Tax=Haloglycomyces albus TaxID=526067 RepID=UPI00046CBB89|nr:acyl carrier protein [Haloglycomyces albus]